MTVISSVSEPYWSNRPVAIVGAGPSLRGFDFTRLAGPWHVLAINQKIWDLPFADACFSLDVPWMRDGHAQRAADTGVPLWLAAPDPPQHELVRGAHYLRRSRTAGLSDRPDTIEMGGTSGYGGFNFAYLKRARFVVLFGFDYADQGAGHDKPDQYPWHPVGHNARYWPRWATNFNGTTDQIKRASMRVFNASPNSNVTAFPRCTRDEGLEILRNHIN